MDKLQKDIDLLEPKDRIKVLIELSKFVVPTLKSVDITENEIGGNQPKRIVFVRIPELPESIEYPETLNELKIPDIGNRG